MWFLGIVGRALVEFVLPSVATAVGALIATAIARFLKTQKIDLTAAQAARIQQIAESAVRAVEERARRNPAMTSQEKQRIAAAIIKNTLDHEHMDVPLDTVHDAIDAALPDMRAATGPTVQVFEQRQGDGHGGT